MNLVVLMTTFNNVDYMPQLTVALAQYSDVVVVDSGSTDGTVDRARGQGWKVLQRPYESQSNQLNWALKQLECDWVFILDSDELPLFSLEELLETISKAESSSLEAIAVKRRNVMFGKWIRHGGFYPDLQVRMLRQSARLSYENVAAHGHVMVERKRLFISDLELTHDAYSSVSEYWQKFDKYTTLEKSIDYSFSQLSYRPSGYGLLKTLSRRIPARSLVHFVYRYFIRMGFLDGARGWHLALWGAVYQDVVNAKDRFEVDHE